LSLFPTIFIVCGKVNFTNLSRYSDLNEKTYRRQYAKPFNFDGFNANCIEEAIPESAEQIASMDSSFIRKSGKHSYGLANFYNGSTGRAEKGLEISLISIIDVDQGQGYGLSVQQTPPECGSKQADSSKAQVQETRIDQYLKQLKAARPLFPKAVKCLVVDGYYSKKKFIDGALDLELEVIGKLRIDANLRYFYTGPQKARGAKRLYDAKVDLSQLDELTYVGELEPQVKLYTALVWHLSLKRTLRIVYLLNLQQPDKPHCALLFSTDVTLSAWDIVRAYKARFQIEFIFRDAKQFTGLADCQARDKAKLDFHFNAALSALNMAKLDATLEHRASPNAQEPFVFSMSSYKRRALNVHLLERFISMLDLDPTLIKSHPNYQNLCSYGLIAS
jgi:hypothetical protein